MPKGTKQDAVLAEVIAAVLADDAVKTRWLDLARPVPTEANPARTLLEKHLTAYTQKNKADYFIHKDLAKFLNRELDFYIKTEVMNLDDVQHASAFAAIEKNLRMIQCLRAIAQELISFLAQIENFQKKLWLKKKFVTETNYCITLDRVPEDLYPEIAANEAQTGEWVRLFAIDEMGTSRRDAEAQSGDLFGQTEVRYSRPLTVEYLKANPYLVLDTAFFDATFKARLLASIENFDEQCDGLLIHSENFQALNLLQERYREQVKCIYIDPPYNTGADGFTYKDGYKSSSWISLVADRVRLAKSFNAHDGLVFASIDDKEVSNLDWVLSLTYGFDPDVYPFIWHLPRGINAGHIAKAHEYILPYFVDRPKTGKFNKPARLEQTSVERCNKQIDARHPESEISFPAGIEFEGDNAEFEDEIPGSERVQIVSGKMTFENGKLLNPVTLSAGWTVKNMILSWLEGKSVVDSKGQSIKRFFFKKNGKLYYEKDVSTNSAKSVITGLADTQDATAELLDLFGGGNFTYPKAQEVLKYLFELSTSLSDTILDYFAGSGTTGHAVINLNREDGGKRKYILVEMGTHFDTVLKPRIQKVIYSKDWKDGKPLCASASPRETNPFSGISHCFKYLRLESYEDTLNNIALQQSEGDLFTDSAREDFLLHYMLDVESRGSLLSVADFQKPFDYSLKIAVDSAGATERRPVDLVETFNYLIGLRVQHIDAQYDRGFVTITGTLPTGESTLVLWRDCEKIGYEELDKLCRQLNLNPKDSEYDVVYINGDHNIPALAQETEAEGGITRQLKLRQIEPEFLNSMFAVEDV